MPDSGGISGLGATPLGDGRILFGCYHPNAARMYVMGSFNDWQRPGADNEDPTKFLECQLQRGYFGLPNTWLLVTDRARVGDEYKGSISPLNQEPARNIVTVQWPQDFGTHGFYQWARRLIRLRSRYPGLKLRGYNPAETGQFAWIVAPWLDQGHGGGERAVGWRSRVNQLAHDAIVVLLNFENHDVTVDLELGIPGVWVKLADIDTVNDVAPEGSNSAGRASALRSADGRFAGFVMSSSSGFVYKWEAAI